MTHPQPAPNQTRARLSRVKLVVFALLPALILLFAAEVVVRMAGYSRTGKRLPGPVTTKVQTHRDSSIRSYHIPPLDQRTIDFTHPKPQGVVRIYCTGGSSVDGHNFWGSSWPKQLEVILSATYPERTFEVINGGMIGQDSFSERAIVEAVMDEDVDILLIQTGNNELLQLPTLPEFPGDGIVHGLVPVSRLLTTLVASSAVQAPGKPRDGAKMMRRWPLVRRSNVYEDFRDNLQAMVQAADAVQAATVIANLPSTLYGLGSITRNPACDPHSEEARAFMATVEEALAAGGETGARILEGVSRGTYADWALWHQGRLAIEEGDPERGWSALDRIEQRLPPGPPFNRIIEEVAAEEAIPLVDLRRQFRGRIEQGTNPYELVVDGIHFTVKGNYLVATAFARALEAQEWGRKAAMPSLDEVLTQLQIGCDHYEEGLYTYGLHAIAQGRPDMVPALLETVPEGCSRERLARLSKLVEGLCAGEQLDALSSEAKAAYAALQPSAQAQLQRDFPGGL